ncbi:MAG: polysaccharide deacetylase family protein [Alphaproteobacteria bacterium]
MSGWDLLAAELDAWSAMPGGAVFWWRDDDLVRPGPRIERLVALSDRFAAPLLLAVIPEPADPAIAGLAGSRLRFCQHGWAHADHSTAPPPGQRRRKIELGGDYGEAALVADLRRGWDRLRRILPDRLLPVLVPPWNRIAPWAVDRLPGLGYAGWSGFGARAAMDRAVLPAVNVHVDVIDWHGSGGFVGEAAALDQVVGHLRARRGGQADPAEPTGLMTHHAVHDPATWAFVAGLLEAVSDHPAARWASPDALFAGPTESACPPESA